MISISKIAAQEIKRLQSTRQKVNSNLRLKVLLGGCLDFYYLLEFDQGVDGTDFQYESSNITIVVDAQSQKYFESLTIDYSEDLMGGGFMFQNPNASSTCDCGHSFALTTLNE